MGQMTLGLLYGIEIPTLSLDDDEQEAGIDALLDGFHMVVGLPRSQPRVVQTFDAEPALLGVWVALGGSGAPNIAYFVEEAIPIDALTTHYAADIAEAQRIWEEFTVYCAEQEQLEVPAARLWITPTEVA